MPNRRIQIQISRRQNVKSEFIRTTPHIGKMVESSYERHPFRVATQKLNVQHFYPVPEQVKVLLKAIKTGRATPISTTIRLSAKIK